MVILLIPMTEAATHGDASQQDEDHEHVDEPGIIDNRVEANHDVISPQTGIERWEQTSLQEVVNQQPRRSTRERKPSIRYPSSVYVLIYDEGGPKN